MADVVNGDMCVTQTQSIQIISLLWSMLVWFWRAEVCSEVDEPVQRMQIFCHGK
jgi:hypothetical protein